MTSAAAPSGEWQEEAKRTLILLFDYVARDPVPDERRAFHK